MFLNSSKNTPLAISKTLPFETNPRPNPKKDNTHADNLSYTIYNIKKFPLDNLKLSYTDKITQTRCANSRTDTRHRCKLR